MKTPVVLLLVTVAVNVEESLAHRSSTNTVTRTQRQVGSNRFPFSPSNGRFPSNFEQNPFRQDRNRPNVPQWMDPGPSSGTRQRQNQQGGRGPLQFPPSRFQEPKQGIGSPRDESDDDDRFIFDIPSSVRPPPRVTSVGPPPRSSTSTTPRSQAQVDATDNCIANCPVTSEFNPVCGSDEVTYTNPGRLKCAVMCGRGVSIGHYGNCITTSTQASSSTARSSLRRA